MTNAYQRVPCAKGPIPYCLDELSKRSDARELLKSLRDAIVGLSEDNYRGLEKAFSNCLFEPMGFSSKSCVNWTESLRTQWFDEHSSDAYFKVFQPVAPIYAEGVLKTIDLSLSGNPAPKLIDSWWVMGYSDFQMINFASDQQVSLIIATPEPAPPPPLKIMGDNAEVWLTSEHGTVALHEPSGVRRKKAMEADV